jgi:hypothetical protein
MRTDCLATPALDTETEIWTKWKAMAIGTPLFRMVYFGTFFDG